MKVKSENEVVQSCPTLRDPREGSLPGSSALGIFQARVLEWGAIAFSVVTMESYTNISFVIGHDKFIYYILACVLNTYFEYRDELNTQLTMKDKSMYIVKNYYSKFILIF